MRRGGGEWDAGAGGWCLWFLILFWWCGVSYGRWVVMVWVWGGGWCRTAGVAGRAGALRVCEQAGFIAAAGPRLGPVAARVVGQLRGTGRTWTGGKQAGTKACRTTASKLWFFFSRRNGGHNEYIYERSRRIFWEI